MIREMAGPLLAETDTGVKDLTDPLETPVSLVYRENMLDQFLGNTDSLGVRMGVRYLRCPEKPVTTLSIKDEDGGITERIQESWEQPIRVAVFQGSHLQMKRYRPLENSACSLTFVSHAMDQRGQPPWFTHGQVLQPPCFPMVPRATHCLGFPLAFPLPVPQRQSSADKIPQLV